LGFGVDVSLFLSESDRTLKVVTRARIGAYPGIARRILGVDAVGFAAEDVIEPLGLFGSGLRSVHQYKELVGAAAFHTVIQGRIGEQVSGIDLHGGIFIRVDVQPIAAGLQSGSSAADRQGD